MVLGLKIALVTIIFLAAMIVGFGFIINFLFIENKKLADANEERLEKLVEANKKIDLLYREIEIKDEEIAELKAEVER